MNTKSLTAAQIDTLVRLLAAQIGTDRAALAFISIMTAATAEQAEARMTLVLDYGSTEAVGEAAPTPEQPKAATAPVIGERQAILDQAQSGALPESPNFAKPNHVRFRARLAQIVA